MTDLTELKRLAEVATPGEWRVAEDNNPFADGRHVFAAGLDGSDFVVANLKTDHTFPTATSRVQQQKNAAFIASANPATVLSLIAQIEHLKAEREKDREALRFYASEQIYDGNGISRWSEAIKDCGRRARARLEDTHD